MKNSWRKGVLLYVLMLGFLVCRAQQDSVRSQSLDSFILRQKGFLGELARNLLASREAEPSKVVQRNDAAFQRYRGSIIRRIIIQPVNFGINISDTGKSLNNKLTRLLDRAHRTTKEEVVRRNLFFHEGQVLSPYLVGASERHLRDLAYLQEAKIHVVKVWNSNDSVDIVVFSKDAFSLGGGINFMEATRFELKLQEDNFLGRGDRALISGFYDMKRRNPIGYGGEYALRNIKGSFIDGYAGFQSYSSAFSSGKHDECNTYIRLIKPLLNPFMKWTYALEASHHQTVNLYFPDSIYHSDFRYRYDLYDMWAGWNFTADQPIERNREDRLNWLVGGRLLQRYFIDRPEISGGRYFYRYTNLSAALGAISMFRQTFYKTRFIYGFGQNEDVPEGMDASITTGWTKTAGVERPYMGVDLQRYYFTRSDNYFNYTFRIGAYRSKTRFEDVNLLTGLDYFSRLRLLGNKWKQRTFISGSFARQFNYRLIEPLFLESMYGLTSYKNNRIGGDIRITLKAESVFFSPWTVAYFHLAPFAFGSATLFRVDTNKVQQSTLYPSIGAGLRIQNESLIFGTIELKAAYFPRPDSKGKAWEIGIGTNIRFRYNREFIKRPELVGVN